MKPVTKLEREVVELSSKLAPPSPSDLQYFTEAGTRHVALYTGKRVKCTDCGHEWRQDGLKKQVRCPHCGRMLIIENTRSRKKYETVYCLVLQSCQGWQVCRYFQLHWICPVKGGRQLSMAEVVQNWISSDGKVYVIARKRTMGMYIDSWSMGEPMSLKRNVDNSYSSNAYHPGYWGVIVKSVTPKLRRNGFKNRLYGMSPYYLFPLLLTNPFAETLYKAGYGYLLRQLDYGGKMSNNDYISAAKIVLRNRYMVKKNDWGLWTDMVRNLIELGKDVHNPHYVCPKNLIQAHDRAQRQVMRMRERERARAEAERIRKDKRLAKTYVSRMKKYFGMVITDGKIVVCALKNLSEFEAEGKAMHHCVFTNRYYAKENSLIMSAKVGGKRQETVEIDLRDFRIVQSRGVNNQSSKYHDKIVSLVEQNMAMIRAISLKKKRS